MTKHLVAVVFVFLCSAFCGSQTCSGRLDSMTFTCTSSTCSNRVTVYKPTSGDRIRYSCTSEDCCGQLFTTCTDDGGCGAVEKNPEVRARIDDVAKTSEVLVADCKGRYALYTLRRERTINLDRLLAADRILR